MTPSNFERIVEDQLNTTRNLLIVKAQEYSLNEDRLEVFKKAACLQGETVKQALCGMLAKHIISIYDMSMSDETFTEDRWTEKITDSINYLLLLKAAIIEESQEKPI
jgi:hypothetical protein